MTLLAHQPHPIWMLIALAVVLAIVVLLVAGDTAALSFIGS